MAKRVAKSKTKAKSKRKSDAKRGGSGARPDGAMPGSLFVDQKSIYAKAFLNRGR